MIGHQFGQNLILGLDLLLQVGDPLLVGGVVRSRLLLEGGRAVLEELLIVLSSREKDLKVYPQSSLREPVEISRRCFEATGSGIVFEAGTRHYEPEFLAFDDLQKSFEWRVVLLRKRILRCCRVSRSDSSIRPSQEQTCLSGKEPTNESNRE